MAVVTCYHIPNDERSTAESGVTEVWNYLVSVSAITDTASVAEAGVAYAFGADHPTDAALSVTASRTSRKQDEPLVWEVQVTFGTTADDTGATPPPDAEGEIWGVRISFSGVAVNETVNADRDDFPILNSALQFFDPGPEKTYYYEQMTVSCRCTETGMADVFAAIQTARGKVNAADVTLTVNGLSRVFEAEKIKLVTADYNTTTEGALTYWEINYTFVYRDKGWTLHLLNHGMYKRVGGVLENIKDKYGNDVSAPVLLTADGTAESETATFMDYDIEETADFTGLFSGMP